MKRKRSSAVLTLRCTSLCHSSKPKIRFKVCKNSKVRYDHNSTFLFLKIKHLYLIVSDGQQLFRDSNHERSFEWLFTDIVVKNNKMNEWNEWKKQGVEVTATVWTPRCGKLIEYCNVFIATQWYCHWKTSKDRDMLVGFRCRRTIRVALRPDAVQGRRRRPAKWNWKRFFRRIDRIRLYKKKEDTIIRVKLLRNVFCLTFPPFQTLAWRKRKDQSSCLSAVLVQANKKRKLNGGNEKAEKQLRPRLDVRGHAACEISPPCNMLREIH